MRNWIPGKLKNFQNSSNQLALKQNKKQEKKKRNKEKKNRNEMYFWLSLFMLLDLDDQLILKKKRKLYSH